MVPLVSVGFAVFSALAFLKAVALAFGDDQLPCSRTAKPVRAPQSIS